MTTTTETRSASRYDTRSAWIQAVCPAPKRLLQSLIVKHGLSTGLDVGFGRGSPLSALRGTSFRATGLDTSEESIAAAQRDQLFDDYIVGDFLGHDFAHSYDVVVLSHVIEHFARDEGMEVLRKAETLARRLLYVETPNGFLEQEAKEGNARQRHLSGWFSHDFESRGYTVFGSGMRALVGPGGRPRFLPSAMNRTAQRLVQRYFFTHPRNSAVISAIRMLDGDGTPRTL